jgi:hypothetical protein
MFGSLLVCDVCGSRLWRSGKTRTGAAVRYRCSRAIGGRCDQPSVAESVLWADLLPLLLDHLDPRRARRRRVAQTADRSAAELRLAEIRESLLRLTSAYTAAGRTTEPEFLTQAELLWQERDALEATFRDEAQPLPMTLPGSRRELRALLTHLAPQERATLLQRVVIEARVRDQHLVGTPRLR